MSTPAIPLSPSELLCNQMILGKSAAIQDLRTRLFRLGPHYRVALLRGEPGTGKELVARTLHALSSHSSGPFIIHDPATGDADIHGLMKAAHRGTLYLRNVEQLAPAAQTTLVGVLQSLAGRQQGRILIRGLEARIIASTSQDLRVHTASGRFLPELYTRISTVEVQLPALRERNEDIALLAQYFVQRRTSCSDKDLQGITKEGFLRLEAYEWPGNVRELKNIVEHAAEKLDFGRIGIDHIVLPANRTARIGTTAEEDSSLQSVIEKHVLQVLMKCAGNKVRAAEMLGISRSTLYRMLDVGLQEDRLQSLG